MDNRTYDADSDVDGEQMTHFDARAELNAYAAENARLTHELDTRIRQLMQLSKDFAALLGTHEQTRAELTTAQDNAAELGKALDMCIAERDSAFAEVDAQAKRHAEIISQWKAEENMWRYYDKKQLAQIDALRAELAGAQDMATAATQAWRTATAERDAHRRELSALRDERPRLLAANARLADEREAAHREADAQTLKANSFRGELHRYIVHANELKEMLDISVAERDTLRAELDATKTEFASYQKHAVEFACRRQDEVNALRAELDAMREAHSVIAARMAAMGC